MSQVALPSFAALSKIGPDIRKKMVLKLKVLGPPGPPGPSGPPLKSILIAVYLGSKELRSR